MRALTLFLKGKLFHCNLIFEFDFLKFEDRCKLDGRISVNNKGPFYGSKKGNTPEAWTQLLFHKFSLIHILRNNVFTSI